MTHLPLTTASPAPVPDRRPGAAKSGTRWTEPELAILCQAMDQTPTPTYPQLRTALVAKGFRPRSDGAISDRLSRLRREGRLTATVRPGPGASPTARRGVDLFRSPEPPNRRQEQRRRHQALVERVLAHVFPARNDQSTGAATGAAK